MEDPALPPFEQVPSAEPVQLSHEQLTAAAGLAATAIDFIDNSLAAAVEHGALTEEDAAAERAQAVEALRQKLGAMEEGRWVHPVDPEAQLCMSFTDLAFGGLDMFDRAGHAAIAAGELTEEEFMLRRRQLVERHTRTIEGLDTTRDE